MCRRSCRKRSGSGSAAPNSATISRSSLRRSADPNRRQHKGQGPREETVVLSRFKPRYAPVSRIDSPQPRQTGSISRRPGPGLSCDGSRSHRPPSRAAKALELVRQQYSAYPCHRRARVYRCRRHRRAQGRDRERSTRARYFGGRCAVGRHLGDEGPTSTGKYEIVGVVADARTYFCAGIPAQCCTSR